MKLSELYKTAVKVGIENDPRGEEAVKKILADEKKKLDELKDDEKRDYDPEKLSNPYADTRILNGTGEEEIKSALVGIDMETPELLLLETLRRGGKKIDMAICHHPEGRAYANLHEVMYVHSDVLNKFGVPINIAEAIMEPRIREVSRRVMPQNHTRATDAARLLGIPLMSAHTVADNCVTNFLQKLFDSEKPEKIEGIIKILNDVPEYRKASTTSRGPAVVVGSKEKRAGRILVDMTGGTEGSIDAFEKLAISGVGTIVGMHMSEEHIKNAEKFHVNVVIAGHISSDTIGLNILFDGIEKSLGQKLDFVECSGFMRYSRNK